MHGDATASVQEASQELPLLIPRYVGARRTRKQIQDVRLYTMQQFLRSALSGNPIIPTPRHMHLRIEEKHAIPQRIAAPKIVKEPAVEAVFAKSPLDL